jgi:hypothetical protein
MRSFDRRTGWDAEETHSCNHRHPHHPLSFSNHERQIVLKGRVRLTMLVGSGSVGWVGGGDRAVTTAALNQTKSDD